MYLIAWNCTLKTVKMVNFMLYIFYHNKKKNVMGNPTKNLDLMKSVKGLISLRGQHKSFLTSLHPHKKNN